MILITDCLDPPRQHGEGTSMPDDIFSLMRDSIIAGAPDTATYLARKAIAAGTAPLDAINNGYVPGMHDVGEQFARGQMFLPDMMASA
ncbi:MAG TPA: B12-binding domain-containing protein, partial [Terriglobales bacterium]|nr:B12-binding domain-containing protein [Terriglobales bacterium]